MLKDTNIPETELEDNIADADDILYDDLSKYVDWDEIEALTEVPRVIGRLAQYQTAMLTIIRNFMYDDNMAGSGEGRNTAYVHYKNLYDNLLEQLASGSIRALDSDNEELEPDQMRAPGIGRIT